MTRLCSSSLALSEGTHQVVLTNQDEGGLFALEYFVAVSSASTATMYRPITVKPWLEARSWSNTACGPGPTSVFGNPPLPIEDLATTGVIGGVLGALLGLVSPHMHRHYPPANIARCISPLLPGGTTSTAGRCEGRFLLGAVWSAKRAQVRRRVRPRTISRFWPMMRFDPSNAT